MLGKNTFSIELSKERSIRTTGEEDLVRFLTISLAINGITSESNSPLILKTFEGLTGLTEVEVAGAARNFAMTLKRLMEEPIDANASVLERSRQKNAYQEQPLELCKRCLEPHEDGARVWSTRPFPRIR